MKLIGIFIILVFTIFSGIFIQAQDIGNYFTPYGFQYPNLTAGQYALTLRGDYSDFKYNRKSGTNSLIDRHFEVNSYATFSGLLALTDQFMISADVEYHPRRFASDQLTSVSVLASPRLRELQYSSFRPSFGLVYKPSSNLEIFGNFGYSYNEYDFRDYNDYYDEEYDVIPYWQRRYSGAIGITYLGKL